jgi:hypothetical protein
VVQCAHHPTAPFHLARSPQFNDYQDTVGDTSYVNLTKGPLIECAGMGFLSIAFHRPHFDLAAFSNTRLERNQMMNQ